MIIITSAEESGHDLVAVEAHYHITCYNKFRKQVQEIDNSGAGRPVDNAELNVFSLLCRWLETEGDAEIYPVKELNEQMAELDNGSDDIYSLKAFREKLKSHYGDHICFAYIGGSREEVACFRNMVVTANYLENL